MFAIAKTAYRKYGWMLVMLTVAEILFLYITDSRWLFTFLFHSPLEIYQQNYPRFGWLIYGLVKGHLLVVFVLSFWWSKSKARMLMLWVQSFQGDVHISLWQHIGISALIMGLFTLVYYTMDNFVTSRDVFFTLQLQLSHILLFMLLLQVIVGWWLSRQLLRNHFTSLLTTEGSAVTLAVIRILAGYLLFSQATFNLEENAYWASMPHNMRVSLPYMGWFIQNAPISPDIYKASCYMLMVCAIFVMLGLFTRWTMLLAVLLSIYVIGVPMFYGKLFHRHIAVWIAVMLIFSPCADVCSFDRLIKKVRGKATKICSHPVYHLPVLLILVQLGIIYFFAGVIKLKDCGLAWALSDSMINQVQLEWAQWYNQVPDFRIDQFPLLLKFGGMTVILFEIYFPFLVLHKCGRWIAFTGGLAMHNFIGYIMYIAFYELQNAYVVFINWGKLLLPTKAFCKKKLSTDYLYKELKIMPAYRHTFIVAGTLLLVNFLCSTFSIHSWPFSSYPTYSAIVPDTRYWVYFDARLKSGDSISVYEEGKKVGFNMESYVPLENLIIDNLRNKDTALLVNNTLKLWRIWQFEVPSLQKTSQVEVWLCQSPLAPEMATQIIEKRFITKLNFD